jgi:hypothetical protein
MIFRRNHDQPATTGKIRVVSQKIAGLFRRSDKPKIPTATVTAILLGVIALAVAAGLFRWSWIILDEQISLRRDFMELQNQQEQLNIQFDFWNGKLQEERQAIKDLQKTE